VAATFDALTSNASRSISSCMALCNVLFRDCHRADPAAQILAGRVVSAESKHKGRSLPDNSPVRRLRQLPVALGDKARPRSRCSLCGAKRANTAHDMTSASYELEVHYGPDVDTIDRGFKG
jgi:hypothetical protein